MGIELPTPQGEARFTPPQGTERPASFAGSERVMPQQGAEIRTTEAPSSQELRTGQGAGDGFVAPATSDVTTATTTPTTAIQGPTQISLDDVPVVAADEDLIEKQWVESAKRIITQTRNDPYQQGEAISRLQADYLQKRYGKSLPSDGA